MSTTWNEANGYPEAKMGARAWGFPCRKCPTPQHSMNECAAPAACDEHWAYMLASSRFLLLLQCHVNPEHVYEVDSRTGEPMPWWNDHRRQNVRLSPYRLLLEFMGVHPN